MPLTELTFLILSNILFIYFSNKNISTMIGHIMQKNFVMLLFVILLCYDWTCGWVISVLFVSNPSSWKTLYFINWKIQKVARKLSINQSIQGSSSESKSMLSQHCWQLEWKWSLICLTIKRFQGSTVYRFFFLNFVMILYRLLFLDYLTDALSQVNFLALLNYPIPYKSIIIHQNLSHGFRSK